MTPLSINNVRTPVFAPANHTLLRENEQKKEPKIKQVVLYFKNDVNPTSRMGGAFNDPPPPPRVR